MIWGFIQVWSHLIDFGAISIRNLEEQIEVRALRKETRKSGDSSLEVVELEDPEQRKICSRKWN